MIRYSVFYPVTEGASFDHDYYRDQHVPLAAATWSPESTEIDTGVDGPYEAVVHFTFASLEVFQAAVSSPDTEKVRDDVPNYTTIVPIRQLSTIHRL